MLDRLKRTEKELTDLLRSIVILIDTREKKNEHITSYFDKYDVPHKRMALPCGDYSFMLPENPELKIPHDLYFYNDIIIERKGSAEELSGNFSNGRMNFNDEFSRARAKKRYLMIESCSYDDIVRGNYHTDYGRKSFLASLHSFNQKYNLEIFFLPDKSLSPVYIYCTLQSYLRYLVK